jgi:pyruvate/2-oxoglutarate dehydrogenase complex dihydrolipoamide dehydrogenase (E3) component
MRFDLLVLGDTPDAWAAAETAARLGRRTAVLRHDPQEDGTATGVAAVLAAYGDAPLREREGVNSPRSLCETAAARHEWCVSDACHEYGIRNWRGRVRLTGPQTVEVAVEGNALAFESDRILIATGSAARRPPGLDRSPRILVPEDVARLSDTPETLLVIGGNRTARAFARLFTAAGSEVTLLDAPGGQGLESTADDDVLQVVAGEVASLRGDRDGARVRLTDRRELAADMILFAADRPGATVDLGVDAAGLEADEDGRLWCDEDGRTWVHGISAAGEVVGYPRRLREDSTTATEIVGALFQTAVTRRRGRAVAV